MSLKIYKTQTVNEMNNNIKNKMVGLIYFYVYW